MPVAPIRAFARLAAFACLALCFGCQHEQRATGQPPIPRAEKIPRVFELHGERRVDDYYWLRERENPKVLAYLKQENAYAEKALAHTRELQRKLYDEFVARLEETDESAPQRLGEYYYYARTRQDLDYLIHCRKHLKLSAPEEVLLDENELAKGHEYFGLGAFVASPNHERLAYSIDTTGAERYTLRFRDLKTGKDFAESIPGCSEKVAWAADNQTVFYATLDAANRPHKVFRHELGGDPRKDPLIFEEPDESYVVDVDNSSSKAYVFINLVNNSTSETRFLPADRPTGEFAVLAPRESGVEYVVGHQGDRFLILTNHNAKNFRLVEAPTETPGKEHWQDVAPHRADVKLEGLGVFARHAVLLERANGLLTFEVLDAASGERRTLAFDEPTYTLELAPLVDYESGTFRFLYDSFLTPLSVYDYDLVAQEKELKKRDKVLGGYDPAKYASERVFATAADGTRVPISLVHKKELPRDGRNPCLLDGYGAYGVSNDPVFNSEIISLLDRGFVVAMAHVRGGGENGREWYEQGKLHHKKNSFTDFIACAEHLVAEKYTSPERLAIKGSSAGGLLVGAVVNMRPDLFRAVVADVPFVDALTTMLDPSIPLTVMEFEEWGNPTIEAEYRAIRAYSPYDNVSPQRYPHMLILASWNDTRVGYWEPAKWAARLRATKTDDNLLLLKTHLSAGHFGGSGRYDTLEQRAFEFAFILDRLEVK